MDDLATLHLKLKSVPQPLTQTEMETLDKIIRALKSKDTKNSDSIRPLDKPEFKWIEKAENFKFNQESPETISSTEYETSNTIVVDKSSLDGVNSITTAIQMAKDNTTIIVEKGIYSDNIISDKTIHIIGREGAKLLNQHIEVKSGLLTIKGFSIKSDLDIVSIIDGTFAMKDCTLESSSMKACINVGPNTSLEIQNCSIVTTKAIDAAPGTIVTIISSSIVGNNHFFKSDVRFIHSKFSHPSGICFEASSTSAKVDRCLIQDCRDIAFSLREHSSISLETTEFSNIKGAGILLHSQSQMICKNIRIFNCAKAGLIISRGASGEVTGSVICNCRLSGCEVLYSAQLTLNESWISDVKGSCIFCEDRSMISTTRSVISSAGGHGVEAGNGCVLRLKDTLCSNCNGTGILASSSNLTAQMCEFSGHKEACIFGEDAIIELTNCAVCKGKSDGIFTEPGSTISINACYFSGCMGNHIFSRQPKDTKIVESTFLESIYTVAGEPKSFEEIKFDKTRQIQYLIFGGLTFDSADMIIIDSCYICRNMIRMLGVKNGIITQSHIIYAISKHPKEPTRTVEISDESSVTIESSSIDQTSITTNNAKLAIRKCTITNSGNFALQGANSAKLIIENNEFSDCRSISTIKDNTNIIFSYNNVKNVKRSKNAAKAGETSTLRSANLQRTKAINIKEFSSGTIEGNFFSGDYDYAIFIDGQSKVDCLTNQVQTGTKGGIIYAGMSYGRCEENEFSGKATQIEFIHKFTPAQPI